MQKSRLYIFQILGVIMLIVGYLLSDKPDSQSVMHFNLSSNHVISGVSLDNTPEETVLTSYEHHHHHHKLRITKYHSYQLIMPHYAMMYYYTPLLSINYIAPVSESYCFLFCKEINPPPPKAC